LSKIIGAGDALGTFLVRGRSDGADHGRIGIHAAERIDVCQAQLERYRLSGPHLERIVSRHLGAIAIRIHCGLVATNEPFVECIFDIRGAAAKVENPGIIRFVLGEEEFRLTRTE
jgi:ribosomal protein L16/L10AE